MKEASNWSRVPGETTLSKIHLEKMCFFTGQKCH